MLKQIKSMLVRLMGMGVILVSVAQTAQAIEIITYYHTDGLGSPIAGTDESGNLLWKEDYKPFGERIRKQNNSEGNSRWFTGHPEDTETGFIYAGARHYDPVVGRFMSIDPIGFVEGNVQSFNRYAYVNNNPYKYTDPTGEFLEIVGSRRFKAKTEKALSKLKSKPGGRKLVDTIHGSKKIVTIIETDKGDETDFILPFPTDGKGKVAIIRFNPNSTTGGVDDKGSNASPSFVGLAHELGHAEDAINSNRMFVNRSAPDYGKKGTTPADQVNPLRQENIVRKEHNLTLRSFYFQ